MYLNPPNSQARNADRIHVGISFEPHERINKRYPVIVRPQDAPDPVRDSRFIGGRGLSVVPARRVSAYTWDPANWALWEEDQFRGTFYKVYFNAVSKSAQIAGPRGPSWGLRANIQGAQPISHGDLVGEMPSQATGDDMYFPGGF
jgi:hypothetical protein